MKKFNFFLTALLVFMVGWVSPGWAQSTEYLTGLTNDDKDTDKQMVSFTLPGTYIAGGASKKYVMIDGKKDTEIGGKIRINRKTTNLDKGIEIKVNEGYKITAVEVAFYSNTDAPSSVVGVYADGTSTNLLSAAVECPQNKSKDDVKTFSVSGFEATQLVEFEFGTHDEGATQAIWAMKVTYDEAGGDEPVVDPTDPETPEDPSEDAQVVTLDFTNNDAWNLPVGSGKGIVGPEKYTDGTYTITLEADSKNKFYFNDDGYLMLGKNGASLTLPAFDFDVEKIEVVGRTGASPGTKQNIFVGNVAVSTETTGVVGTNVYAIAEDYQAAGNVYVLKVLSNHYSQITKIIIYEKGAGEVTPPVVEPEVAEVATVAELNALAKDAEFKFTGEATVVANPTAKYLYVKDETASTLIYNNAGGLDFAVGTKLAANWTGKVAIYNGLFEAVPSSELTAVEGEPVEVAYETVDAEAIVAENMNQIVRLEGVTYTALSGKNFTITVGEAEVAGYNQFGLEIAAPEEGKKYNMTGAIGVFNTNVQFQPIAIVEVEDEPVADEPLMTLNGKVLAEPNAIVSEMLSLEKMKEEGINVISMSDPADNVKVDVYEDYFIIKNFMNAEGVDLKCWYQVDDSDEENPQTMVYKYEIVGQEIAEENIPGNVQGSYIEVNKEGYDLQMGMCNLSPVGGWLTIIASKLSDMENFYHYTLDFSEAVEVEKPTVTPAEGEYDELQSFTINFGQAVTIPVEDWDNGVYYVPTPFIEGKNTWAYESAALVPGENEGEVIFSLDKPIVKADTYTLTLPEGCVIFADGTKNPEFTYTYTVTGNNFKVTTEEGEISMTITPADGETVSTLSKFELVLEGFLNIPTWEVEVALYDEAGEEVTQGSFEDNFDGTYSIELWSKVTKAGTYTLKFTIPNQNEAFDVIGTHDYELTYIVDGSDYVEMPYTLAAVTAELPADENYDNMESAVKLGLAQEVVVDEDHFVVKNLFGIEGYDLTAYYQMWGEWCYVMGIQVPGVEEPSQMVEVTPNEEIGTVGLMVSDVTLDPKDGSIYLQVVRTDGDDWNYSYYYIVWNEETATGINNATAAPVALDGAYNLAGQKVSSNFKGIVIKNGKKIAVK